jgi:hypothetical protein
VAQTFEIRRDVVYDEDEVYIILGEPELKKLQAAAGSEKDAAMKTFLKAQAQAIADDRKAKADKIRQVVITARKPSPMDRVEIRSGARDSSGVHDREREPLQACMRLIESWNLLDKDGKALERSDENIQTEMPLCLMDVVWGEVYKYLYPSEVRLSFLPRSAG